MSGPTLRLEGAVAIIALAEPGSGLSLSDLKEFANAIERANADPAAAAILVVGSPGTFCSGGDLGDFLRCADLDELAAVVRRFMSAMVAVDKPIIAAVDGTAVGLGMTMLLHFDAVFATPISTFVAPFSDLGLVPEAGSTLLAPARFGHFLAFELLCLGRLLTAGEALTIGLVSEVTEAGCSEERALAVAHRLTRKPREALRATRRLLRGDLSTVHLRIDAEIAQFRAQLEDPTTARRLGRLTRAIARQHAA